MIIGEWLGRLGLQQYAKSFAENRVDPEVLEQLTAEDLKELGVTALGDRRKLLTAIESLRLNSAPSLRKGERSPNSLATRGGAERRHVTVLFCDLVGSTALSARLDPEDLREIIRRYHSVVTDVARAQDGFVAQYLGDGALIYFGYPVAHEDDAERAVRAALLLRDKARAIHFNGAALHVRAGLATGLVVVGDKAVGSDAAHEPRIMGETPNLAARLQSLGEPDGIVIDAATRRLVGRMFELTEHAAAVLKGFPNPVSSWSVRGEAPVESRFEALRSSETPLVGRDEELELLQRRWQQAGAGSGRLILISGEPGLGKSRLVSAFREQISGGGHIELCYFCSPQYTSTAFHPVIVHLTRAAGLHTGDTAQEKLDKLEGLIAPSELPVIADLLSIPVGPEARLDELAPQEKRRKLFAALMHKIDAMARQSAILLLFEDVHWIDPTTQELVDLLIAKSESLPVMIVLTFRPTFQPQWTAQANATSIVLTRLGMDDSKALIRAISGNRLAPSTVAEITERTDGIPLFAEELTKAVLESSGKELLSIGSEAAAQVPATLHASLMARLDHLGPDAREVAQTGAVIGREFSYNLMTHVARVSGSYADLDGALKVLVQSGLVFGRGTPPDAAYTFKHALVQDAAYSTLLRGQRQNLHAIIAKALPAEIVAPEVLAHHLTQANENEAAAREWFRAGKLANERSANAEAVRNLTNALDCLGRVPETHERNMFQLEVYGALCNPMIAANWLAPDKLRMLSEAESLSASLKVSPPTAILYHRYLEHYGSSNHDNAIHYGRLLAQSSDPELIRRGNSMVRSALFMQGAPLRKLVEESGATVSAFDTRDARLRFSLTYDPFCAVVGIRALFLCIFGEISEARRHEHEALARAESLEHPQSTGIALAWTIIVHFILGDVDAMERSAAAQFALGSAHQLTHWCAWANIHLGYAMALQGRHAKGLAMIETALAEYDAMNFTFARAHFLQIRAEALLAGGHRDAALATLDQALEHGVRTGEQVFRADVLRQTGDILCVQGRFPDAQRSYEDAIAFARQQEAKVFELKAATGLATLWRDQGRLADADRLLASVYGVFTEGFDTPVLKEAQALRKAVSGRGRVV